MNNTAIPARQVRRREQLGHSIAGFGQNMIFGFWSSYMLIFFTDIFGISAAAAGTIMALTRVFDAINDPLSGMIVDSTRTRWGRYRPWLLFAPLPIVTVLVLCFSTQDISATAKVVYAAVTYVLMSTFFDGVDVPFWSLPSAMTRNADERAGLFTSARLTTTFGSVVVSIVAVPLINTIGKGDMAKGYQGTAIVLGVIAVACYFTGFALVREHVEPQKQESFTIRAILDVIIKNKPLLLVLFALILTNTANYIRNGLSLFYIQYNLGDLNLVPIFSVISLPGMFVGMLLTPLLMKKIDKRTLYIGVCVLGAALYGAFFLCGYQNVKLVMLFNAVIPIPLGMLSILASTLISSTIEYAEWKTGQRREGLISSTQTFASKVCIAIGAGLSGVILTVSNYVPNQVQAESTLNIFHGAMTLVPVFLLLLAIVPMLRFELTNKRYNEIVAELTARREGN